MPDETQDQTNKVTGRAGSETHDKAGVLAGDRGDAKAQPSGYRGNNPSTAGPGETTTRSSTPENKDHQLDPSAPGETGTTPGSNAK
jgi:hypothetical protein